MKKLFVSRVLKFIALILPIAALIAFTQTYLFCYMDEDSSRVHGFYCEEKNSLDVVFIGASETFFDFSPGYAYDRFGFTSYPYAIGDNPVPLFLPEIKEAVRQQNPQLIVIEISSFLLDEELSLGDEARLRVFAENVPMSANKLDAIARSAKGDTLSCLVPFFNYHRLWQDIPRLRENWHARTSGYEQPQLLKGMITETGIFDQTRLYDVREDYTAIDLAPAAENYLIELLEYCREQRLDNVVFARFPHKATRKADYKVFCRSNKAGEIITRYGYPYLSLEHETEKIGIDFETDFCGCDHLNAYGCRKLTEYIGETLLDHYQLVPRRQTEENKVHWERCADYSNLYFQFAEEQIQSGNVMLLNDYPLVVSMLDKAAGDSP